MTVNEISVEAGRNGLEVTGKTSEITGSWFLWLAPNTEKRALSTVTEEAGSDPPASLWYSSNTNLPGLSMKLAAGLSSPVSKSSASVVSITVFSLISALSFSMSNTRVVTSTLSPFPVMVSVSVMFSGTSSQSPSVMT